MTSRSGRVLGLALGCFLASTVSGQEWTRFRGPNGTGLSDAKNIPSQWTADELNWKVELPGVGHSSPVMWGDRVFLTSADEEGSRRHVICLSTVDGSKLWVRDYPSTPHVKHKLNSFSSPTPAVDEERVYISWSTPEAYTLFALDHQGNEVWTHNLGPYVSQHSAGPSPIVFEDMVVLGDEQDADSSLVALDRRTGDVRWQTTRKTDVVSYATPCVYQRPGGPIELIFNSSAHGICSVNPHDGTPNWELTVFDKRTVSSPVFFGDLIVGTCGSGAGGNYVAVIHAGEEGGQRPAELAYKIEKAAPYCPTPLVYGDRLFLWSDKGVVTCADIKTGDILWQERVGGNYYGSPICISGRLFCVSDAGEVVVVAASEQFEELGRTDLEELSNSTPGVHEGRLYVRTQSHLFSVGGAK